MRVVDPPLEYVVPGTVKAIATWSDPAAILKVEIWADGFRRILASGLPREGLRCAAASTRTDSPLIIVGVCHTSASRVPQSEPGEGPFTPFHLATAQ